MQKQHNNKNGLSLKTVKTLCQYGNKSWDNIEDIISFLNNLISTDENNYFVAYLFNTVLIGNFKSVFQAYNKHISNDLLINLRVFNVKEEVYIWKKNENTFSWRYRKDSDGDQVYVVDVKQVLWGTSVEPKEHGWSRLYEKRGIELIVPIEQLKVDDKKNRLKILTRHYIDYNEIGQAGYSDTRIVDFIKP
jgi:CRISPR-associated protein (TIGR03984 family)